MEMFSIEYALLATQRALLEVVSPELRAVVVDFCKEKPLLYLCFYYDGAASEKLIDLWECAITEASADLGPDCLLDDWVKRLDFPAEIPLRGQFAYLRYEKPMFGKRAFHRVNKANEAMIKDFSIGYALLAVQSALLGVVSPELRAVVVDVCQEKKILYIHFYYDGPVSEELIDLWECAITEASADLGPDCSLDDGVERLDFPAEIPFRGRFAYLRKE